MPAPQFPFFQASRRGLPNRTLPRPVKSGGWIFNVFIVEKTQQFLKVGEVMDGWMVFPVWCFMGCKTRLLKGMPLSLRRSIG